MDFEFIAGPGQCGKTWRLREHLIQTTLREPQQRIIYIVPEQATLLVQRELLDQHPRHGILNVEILSFNRLAHRILQETGGVYQTLDDMGKSMLLYKVAMDHQKELLYYGAGIGRQGFIGQLKIMMTEMYQYRIDETVLETVMSTLEPDSTLYMKLHDLRILYRGFQEKTASDTIPTEKLLDLLYHRIADSRLLENADIYIDDFYGFTPQQYEVLSALCRKARRIRMTLNLTEEAWKRYRPGMDVREVSGSLFYQTLKTYAKICEMGIQPGISFISGTRQKPELAYLVQNVFSHGRVIQQKPECVHLHKAERPEAEMEWLLSQIAGLVHNHGYQYGDIAIVTGSLEEYQNRLCRMAERYRIPIFIDQRAGLQENPAVQMLEGCLNMVIHGFSYDTVFGFVKTGFLPFPREELDRLENRALAGGWRGRSKYMEEFLALGEQNEELTEWTVTFFEGLAKLRRPNQTVRMYTEILLQLLELGHVQEQLERRADWFSNHAQPLEESLCRQVYDAILSVLDQLTGVLGNEVVTLRQYYEILKTGFTQCRLGMLPPVPDQVHVADVNRSRLGHVKVLFVMGFQDESFPLVTTETGLLTDAERRRSAAYHDMASDQSLRISEQEFLLYTVLAKAKDAIWFSWSTGDGGGHSKRPSQFVSRIEELFCRDTLYDQGTDRSLHPCWLLDAFAQGHYDGAVQHTVRQWLMDNGFQKDVEWISQAANDTTPEEKLERGELWELLELSRRAVSVTQLEQYAGCPFAYFLKYGLGLREREILDVRPLDDGNVLHMILQEAGEYLRSAIQEPVEETDRQISLLMEEHSEEFARYQASRRYQYYWAKLKKTAVRAVQILKEQIRQGEFQPEAFEWTFGGEGSDAPALTIPLKDGRRLHLMGKIDRIDILRDEDGDYVRILDYKTARTDWNVWEVYEGLKLQLPVYLDAYQSNRSARPAGIFYFHLTPVLQKADAETGEEEKHRKVMRSARLEGLLLKDAEIAEKMDSGLQKGSVVIPAHLKKDRSFYATSSVADAEQFESLRQFTRRKAAQLSERIVDGHMEPAPVMREATGASVCEYCEYRSACRLDPRVDGNRFRRVGRHTKEDFWTAIASNR